MANFLDEHGLSTLWERIKELVNVKTTGMYSKPPGGIPKIDLTSEVQTSLDKADTAVQSSTLADKMDKANPTGTGSFSLNRKTGTARGTYSFAEGSSTTASGSRSHAEGDSTVASGNSSHAEGSNTTASGFASHAQGKYNVDNSSHADIVGNGTADVARSNAYALDWEGNGHYAGDIYVGCNADSSGGTKLAKITDIPTVGTSDGSIRIGDMLIQWGTVSINPSSGASGSGTIGSPYYKDATATFPIPFSEAPHVTPSVSGNWTGTNFCSAGSITNANCNIRLYTSSKSDTARIIRWLAVGKA